MSVAGANGAAGAGGGVAGAAGSSPGAGGMSGSGGAGAGASGSAGAAGGSMGGAGGHAGSGQAGAGGAANNNLVGQARLGVFRMGTWYIDSNNNGSWDPGIDATFTYGLATDIPVTGDWTGEGRPRVGVFRGPTWILDENGDGVLDGADPTSNFGLAGDVPVTGDWTGGGRTLIGVYRNGDWYLDIDGDRTWNPSVDKHYSFGGTGYQACTGDWTGTGVSRLGLFQPVSPNNAIFTLDINGDGTYSSGDVSVYYGLHDDIPVPGQWGNTRRSQIGIFRGGVWNLDADGDDVWNGAVDLAFTFGGAGDTPVVFVRP